MTVNGSEAASPVGVGPIIAGWSGTEPCYYFEIARLDGTTERVEVPKSRPGFDRPAKLAAYHARMRVATTLRESGAAVLAHDESSFRGLVAVISMLHGAAAPALPRAA